MSWGYKDVPTPRVLCNQEVGYPRSKVAKACTYYSTFLDRHRKGTMNSFKPSIRCLAFGLLVSVVTAGGPQVDLGYARYEGLQDEALGYVQLGFCGRPITPGPVQCL